MTANEPEDTFSFAITLWSQGSHVVTKQGDDLSLKYDNEKVAYTATLTDEDWVEFWKNVSSAGIWNYDAKYENHDVLDGITWGLGAVHAGRTVKSGGLNAYPGVKLPKYGAKFCKLLDAMSQHFPEDVEVGKFF